MAPKLVRLDFVVLIFLVTFSGVFLFGDMFSTGINASTYANRVVIPPSSSPNPSGGGTGSVSSPSHQQQQQQIAALSNNEIRKIVDGPAGSGVAPGIPPIDNLFPTTEGVTVEALERTNPPIRVLAQAIEGNVSLLALADEVGGEDNLQLGSSSLSSAGSASSKSDAAALSKAEAIQEKITALMGQLYDETAVFSDHDSYIIIRRAFQNALLQSRRKFMIDAAMGVNSRKSIADGKGFTSIRHRAKCFQFARDDQKPRDAISRAPCVPWNSPRLHTVAMGRYGVLSQYHHVDPPTAETLEGRVKEETPTPLRSNRDPLRVGVAMSGQMRTYKRCYQTIVDNVLKTNEALLFIASYPDVGDKRFGVRIQERDDEVDAGEVAKMFAPYLAAMYTADLPTVTRRLNGEFPTLMVTPQHSWMLYQLFMMDLAQTILLRHPLGPMWTDGVYKPFVINKDAPAVYPSSSSSRVAATPWKSFDVVVRIRPDLYIMGPMWIRPIAPIIVAPNKPPQPAALFNFSCGNHTFSKTFSGDEVLRTPHNPYYRWVLDPISDHSAIGFTDKVTSLFELYKDARAMEPSQQEKDIFFHGNTVERMWTQHIERKKLKEVEVFGWHFMLRHPTKFLNSTNLMSNSERRRKLMMNIFAISDPSTVQCPPVDGKMWVLPPKKKGR